MRERSRTRTTPVSCYSLGFGFVCPLSQALAFLVHLEDLVAIGVGRGVTGAAVAGASGSSISKVGVPVSNSVGSGVGRITPKVGAAVSITSGRVGGRVTLIIGAVVSIRSVGTGVTPPTSVGSGVGRGSAVSSINVGRRVGRITSGNSVGSGVVRITSVGAAVSSIN